MFRPNDEPVPGYLLQRMLGRGGFGEVWKALGPGRTPSALKFIGLCGRPGIREFRAIQRVKEIRHAHLLPMHALWILDDQNSVIDDSMLDEFEQTALHGGVSDLQAPGSPSTLVVAMMLGDRSLMDLLQRYKAHGAAGIPPRELLRYMEDSARGIDFLNGRQHDLGSGPISVQHCDIKPHNIILVGDSAMVCDFGLARVLDESQVTTGVAGTPAYMAPECVRGKPLSSTTDQYSLAITYYHLRCGSVPFPEGTPHRDMMSKHVDGTLDLSRISGTEAEILKRATSVKPADRFATTLELVKELQNCSFEAPEISLEGLSDDAIWSTVQACDVDGANSTMAGQPQLVPKTHADEEDYPLGGDVRLTLLGAAAAMKRTNWNIISTVHLWIGMTYLDDGALCAAMRKRGIDPTEARRALRSAIRRETTSKVDSSTSVLSENTEAALSAAKRLARQEGAGKVRERHLLQAIMDTPDAGANLVLELVGMDRRHVVVEESSGVSKTSASADDSHKARFGSRANIEILDADGWLALGSFDEDCRAALEASRRAVAEMGQQQIRIPHLFLGMLQRDNSAVASRLRQGGVDVSQLTNVFWSQVAKSSDGASVSVELHRDSFSEDTLDTLREAGRTAARSGESIISEQRVLGTLVEGESVVARTLEDSGVDSDLLFR